MTGNFLLDTAISVAGIAFLVALCRVLIGERRRRVTVQSAADRLQLDEPDFKALEWIVGEDGRAAIAVGASEACIVFALGDRLVSRRVRTFHSTLDGASMRIDLDDHTTPEVRLRLATPQSAAELYRRVEAFCDKTAS